MMRSAVGKARQARETVHLQKWGDLYIMPVGGKKCGCGFFCVRKRSIILGVKEVAVNVVGQSVLSAFFLAASHPVLSKGRGGYYTC